MSSPSCKLGRTGEVKPALENPSGLCTAVCAGADASFDSHKAALAFLVTNHGVHHETDALVKSHSPCLFVGATERKIVGVGAAGWG